MFTIAVAAIPIDHYAMDTVALHVGKAWKRLGRELNFSDGQLETFEYDYSGMYEQIYQMLARWKQDTGPSATYKVLAQCLVKIKKPDVAEKLQGSPN